MIGPVLISVAPYRLRGMVGAVGGIYVFFIGATGGAVRPPCSTASWGSGHCSDRHHAPPDDFRGDHDHPQRALHPERPVPRRRRAPRGDGGAPSSGGRSRVDSRPASQQRRLRATAMCRSSSGSVSRLRKGEVLALLGTNGAGKSTALTGVGPGSPRRGVVRLNGRDITYTTPEQRSRLGIHLLQGGKGVRPDDGRPKISKWAVSSTAPTRTSCIAGSIGSTSSFPPCGTAGEAGRLASGGQQQYAGSWASPCCTTRPSS